MHNAQQEINWHEILNKVNSDPELNEDNIINKITEATLKAHPGINFNLNNVELLRIAIDYNTKNAAEEKDRVDTINIVKALLAKGIDVKAKDPSDEETFLLRAAGKRAIDIEVIKAIVNAGAEVSAAYMHGGTSLHRAASNDRVDILDFLLEKGADLHALNLFLDTPLHQAAEAGCIEAVKFLSKKGSDVNAVDRFGFTALHLAASSYHVEVILALLKAGANVNATKGNGDTPLYHAAAFDLKKERESQKAMSVLLMYDADIPSGNLYGETPEQLRRSNGTKLFMEKALSELHRMKDEKIGAINGKDVSLHEFFKTDDRKQLLRYYSNDEIRQNIREYLDKYAITDERPIYYDAIKGNFHKGVQLQACYNVIEGDFKKAVLSSAGVKDLTPEIAKHLTDTDVQKVAEKALTKS